MITQIAKGNDKDSGLPQFIKRTGYWHNEEATIVEIYYSVFITYPSGKIVKIKDCTSYLQDTPAVAATYEADGTTVITPAIPASTKYTDCCKQFNADAIGSEIDTYLTTIQLT